MGFNQLDIKLQNIADALDKAMPDLLATQILIETSTLHKKRIFDEGSRTDGTDIGKYSKEESYYPKSAFVRKGKDTGAFKGVGKPNKDGKRKSDNKTMYLAGGYSELRSIQGRKVGKINLKYTGSLEGNLNVLKEGNASLYGTTDLTESDKFNALQDKYDVFEFNTIEKEYLETEIAKAATDIASTN